MKSTICIGVCILLSAFVYAQTHTPAVTNSSGGSFTSGYYQFEWSVGEMSLINHMTDQTGRMMLTNGFLQPYTRNLAHDNNNIRFNDNELKVFPNPASIYVEINLYRMQAGTLYIKLYDAAGRQVFSKYRKTQGIDVIERIPVSQLLKGSYMLDLQFYNAQGEKVKTGIYKIIKIHKS